MQRILLYSFVAYFCCSYSAIAIASWEIDGSGVGYVKSHQSNVSNTMFDIVISEGGTKQIMLRLKPLGPESCQPQGRRNGENGYVVPSKIFINDTLVYTKQFIYPSQNGCFILHAGESSIDKTFIISAFSKASDVYVEVDGINYMIASKNVGEQVDMVRKLGGGFNKAQIVYDTRGKKHLFNTAPSSEVRWYRFTTDNFKNIWRKIDAPPP